MVIIPKLEKASYIISRTFRFIALLNTLEKLIEKMLANHLQFETGIFLILHPNHFVETKQHSMEDARVYLIYIVQAEWT